MEEFPRFSGRLPRKWLELREIAIWGSETR